MIMELIRLLGGAILGNVFGRQRQQRVQQQTDPIVGRVSAQPSATQVINAPGPSLNVSGRPEVGQFMSQTGMTQGFQGVPPALQNAILQGAANRFGVEQELTSEQRGAISQQQRHQGQSIRETQGQVARTRQQTDTGLQNIRDASTQAQAAIDTGMQQVNQNLQQNMQFVQDQFRQFYGMAGSTMSTAMGLRSDALESHADQTARQLDSLTQGVENQLRAQEAEIDGRTDLTPASKEAMKQRLRFINSADVRNAVTTVMANENQRHTALVADQNRMVNDTVNSITGAFASLQQVGTGAATQAFGTATQAQSALSKASADLGAAFAELDSSYRSTMVQAEAGVQNMLNALRMGGDDQLFNMVSNMHRAYVDLSAEYGQIMSLALGVNSLDYNQAMSTANLALGATGMQWQVGEPYYQGGAQVGFGILGPRS